ncbi:MAG: hypothetical protein ABWK53_11970, partial [Anaerolineales bacterium]
MRRFAPQLLLALLVLLLAGCQGSQADPYRDLPTATPRPSATTAPTVPAPSQTAAQATVPQPGAPPAPPPPPP